MTIAPAFIVREEKAADMAAIREVLTALMRRGHELLVPRDGELRYPSVLVGLA